MTTGSHNSIEITPPCRVEVQRLVSSRYDDPTQRGTRRPNSWDERIEGIDLVEVAGGGTVRLHSSPMQSPPKAGWILLLSGGNAGQGFTWTLYGIAPHQ
jgi:hypothetical protein